MAPCISLKASKKPASNFPSSQRIGHPRDHYFMSLLKRNGFPRHLRLDPKDPLLSFRDGKHRFLPFEGESVPPGQEIRFIHEEDIPESDLEDSASDYYSGEDQLRFVPNMKTKVAHKLSHHSHQSNLEAMEEIQRAASRKESKVPKWVLPPSL